MSCYGWNHLALDAATASAECRCAKNVSKQIEVGKGFERLPDRRSRVVKKEMDDLLHNRPLRFGASQRPMIFSAVVTLLVGFLVWG